MTEPRFEELINLYLDNEIGRHELGELKYAIRDNVLRRRKFERACQLHQAARKALTERKDDDGKEDASGQAGQDSKPASGSVSRSGASSSNSSTRNQQSGGSKASLRQRQVEALRNATIPTLAERQSSKGAASSVDLDKISLESSRSSGDGDRALAFSFFDSPIGMTIAVVFTLVGVGGLYLLLKIVSPNTHQDDGNDQAPSGSSVATPLGPIDQKELMRELQGPRPGATSPAEAMHASLYQSAAGQPMTNEVQVNYSSTQSETASPSALPPNALLPNTSATVTVQVSQAAAPGSVNGGVQIINSSQLQIMLPTQPGTPGNQDVTVKMSLPPTVVPSADSGNQDKSGNETTPQVNLP
jgi:hypothetical protein